MLETLEQNPQSETSLTRTSALKIIS